MFDEATSAVDNETEFALMNAIQNLNPDLTAIMIAHRLSTLDMCYKIFEVKDQSLLERSIESISRTI